MKAGYLLVGKDTSKINSILKSPKTSKQQDNVNIAKNDELSVKQDEALASFSRSPDVILQTLIATIRGCDEKCSARAIIVTTSQRSYIL